MADALLLWHRDGLVYIRVGQRDWMVVGASEEFDALPSDGQLRLARARLNAEDNMRRFIRVPGRRHIQ